MSRIDNHVSAATLDERRLAGRSLSFRWGGSEFVLYAGRAAYLPGLATLLIADTHFGKDATFRHAGVALPHGTTGGDLARLSALLRVTQASRLLILGDFFHASRGRSDDTMQSLQEWRLDKWPELPITNVRGNHDLKAGDPPAEWRIEVVEEPFAEGGFVWQHQPSNVHGGGYSLGGHLHPGVVLEGAGGERVKAPCFWFRDRSAVLPAFSDFTGTSKVQPRPSDAVFVVNGEEIARVL